MTLLTAEIVPRTILKHCSGQCIYRNAMYFLKFARLYCGKHTCLQKLWLSSSSGITLEKLTCVLFHQNHITPKIGIKIPSDIFYYSCYGMTIERKPVNALEYRDSIIFWKRYLPLKDNYLFLKTTFYPISVLRKVGYS